MSPELLGDDWIDVSSPYFGAPEPPKVLAKPVPTEIDSSALGAAPADSFDPSAGGGPQVSPTECPAVQAVLDRGGLDVLLGCMRAHQDDQDVQQHCAEAIAEISAAGGEPIAQAVVDAGGLDLVIAAIGKRGRSAATPEDADSNVWATEILARLLCGLKQEQRATLLSRHITEAFPTAADFGDTAVAAAKVEVEERAKHEAAKYRGPAIEGTPSQYDMAVVSSALMAMRSHPDHAEVQSRGAGALGGVLKVGGAGAAVEVVSSEALDAVIYAMRTHKDWAPLVSKGSAVLGQMSASCCLVPALPAQARAALIQAAQSPPARPVIPALGLNSVGSAPSEDQNKPQVAAVEIHIKGIDFRLLKAKQRDKLSESTVAELAVLVGVPETSIMDLEGRAKRVSFRAGSVVIDSRIYTPAGKTVDAIRDSVGSAPSQQRFVYIAKAVPGINLATYGSISATTLVSTSCAIDPVHIEPAGRGRVRGQAQEVAQGVAYGVAGVAQGVLWGGAAAGQFGVNVARNSASAARRAVKSRSRSHSPAPSAPKPSPPVVVHHDDDELRAAAPCDPASDTLRSYGEPVEGTTYSSAPLLGSRDSPLSSGGFHSPGRGVAAMDEESVTDASQKRMISREWTDELIEPTPPLSHRVSGQLATICDGMQPTRGALCATSVCTLALSGVVVTAALKTYFNARFIAFDRLGIECGFSSFFSLVLLVVFTSLSAVGLALAGAMAACRSSIPAFAGVGIAAASVLASALALLVVLLFRGLASEASSALIHAANEVCQSHAMLESRWACGGAVVGNSPADVLAAGARAAAADLFNATGPIPPSPLFDVDNSATARLHRASVALVAAMAAMNGEDRCWHLAAFCAPPPGFDERRACVCREPPPGAPGAYCEIWDPAACVAGDYCEWCLVGPKSGCGALTGPDPDSGLLRSEGPCFTLVDSRSQLVMEGVRLAQQACVAASVLGMSLLCSAWAGLGVGGEASSNRHQDTHPGGAERYDAQNFDDF